MRHPSKYCCHFTLNYSNALRHRPQTRCDLNRAINSDSSQALHVGEQIEQRVIAKSEGSESLLTEEACSAYKAEIEQIVYQINQVPTLPPPSDWYVAEFIAGSNTHSREN